MFKNVDTQTTDDGQIIEPAYTINSRQNVSVNINFLSTWSFFMSFFHRIAFQYLMYILLYESIGKQSHWLFGYGEEDF